jgi:hypothetical protein
MLSHFVLTVALVNVAARVTATPDFVEVGM